MYLIQNENNRVVTRLREHATLTNPFFLFYFENGFDKSTNFTYSTNDLSDSCGFELWQINLNNTTGSTSGGTSSTLKMDNGEWRLMVYESSASTLSISATTGVIIVQDKVVVGTTRFKTF